MTKKYLLLLVSLTFLSPFASHANNETSYERANLQAIDKVWSGNFVRFAFITQGDHQYLGYYDANRQLSVAHRDGSTSPWSYYKVDSWYGWDSHNYITMELDKDGYLHLLGNMHAERVEYFRTRYPHDVRSLKRIDVMENAELERVFTYPNFLKDAKGELVVKYRSGFSGNGVDVYLSYHTKTQTWSRLHDSPLIDGEGLRNAYSETPQMGPDGRFHMVWIWRDTPDAATNHTISYARSKDLIHWENSSGQPLPLPITFDTGDVVDPVPAHGGAINGNNKLGFDAQSRPLVAFHKYDEYGDTQIYLARHEAGLWLTRQITNWKDFRWSFGGTGSLSSFDVRIENPRLLPDGRIQLPVKQRDQSLNLILDADTLQLLETEPAFAYPPIISEVASSDKVLLDGAETYGPELMLKTLSSGGFNNSKEEIFFLSWEAQAPFRGQARDHILPPSTLYLHTLIKRSK